MCEVGAVSEFSVCSGVLISVSVLLSVALYSSVYVCALSMHAYVSCV